MDETLATVAIDLGGRFALAIQADFPSAKIGDFDTELFREYFVALAQNAGITLHVETLYVTNNHHIAETCFKAVARALRAAIAIDPRQDGRVPSTKGSLDG